MGYEIGRGRTDVVGHWRDLTSDAKCDLMGLDDAEIADAMHLVVQQYPQLDATLPSSVDAATTAMVQAMFLHALETCDGKLILEHVSIETIGVLFALERKLLYAVVGKDMHRKCSIAVLYLVWTSSWPYLGMGAYLLVLFSNLGPCTWLRNTSVEYLDAFFLQGPDPLHAEWYFNSYLTALLLLYTSHDAHFTVYIILAIVLALPFGVSALQHSYADGVDDHSALEKITSALSFINKLILVYYCWSSYTSLLMVAALFFDTAAISLASVSFLGVAVVVELAGCGLLRIVPTAYVEAYTLWKERSQWHALGAGLVPVAVAGIVLYGTWDWTSMFGGFVRLVTVLALSQVVPAGHLATLAQLAFLAIALPLQLLQVVLLWLGIKPASSAPDETTPNDASKDADTTEH
ncbi:hypothetical protein SPRG_14068 [Saprolegnia parasitica CBS 223.65]|uniref:Uncharacterized protein n=1 Tax=Saprolegnia parasitica (strain CBS 223.65) TaxID=695850 RepID=A0A067BRF7_SAPPC|nr:hypothetical protein SPRG_14068 [Saprolegnia parasitica CBS 223.65]KDO20838.1 hypothetical protein SPRG_14068 [Saprolegnia parasitica CBS 223.65]|eukprot:XP_012208416.1 hypothetical protein SPRG_14068 [Saprolegnia parasitica CBS 223.65]